MSFLPPPELAAALRRSPAPDAAAAGLETIAEAWRAAGRGEGEWRGVLENFPLGLEAFAHLLAVSPVSVEKLAAEPALLPWLARPEITASDRGPVRMGRELGEIRGSDAAFDPKLRALRRLQRRELLRIALREVAGASPLEATTRELSSLAEVILQDALGGWQKDCARRWGGAPSAPLAVLALGKLGGRDLNFSSDLDLMLLYGEDGWFRANFSFHEYHARVAERLLKSFAAHDPAGPLFRLDLRLRPEGVDGPLVLALANAENYYAGHGETWERLMLAKARAVAGDVETAYEFGRRVHPFVWPRSLAPDVLGEIADLKARIERELPVAELAAPGSNVKLGIGGIREVEFIAGALQLLHGARHAFLRRPSTREALNVLVDLDVLPGDDARRLAEAYGFFRGVEHRLQIEREAQTHSLPEDAAALGRIARSLGLPDAEALFGALAVHSGRVRAVFERVLGAPAAPRGPGMAAVAWADPAAAEKSLARLADGPAGMHTAPRTRRLWSRLEPVLAPHLAAAADPDGTLRRLVRFVEAYGIRSMLLETLLAHPRLLELLARTFDAGDWLAHVLIARPAWMEEILRGPGGLDALPAGCAQLAAVRGAPDAPALRLAQRGTLLRLGFREAAGLARGATLWGELTTLAEASLRRLAELAGADGRVTVLALGKFGGSELSYGADLDVVLLGEDTLAAQGLMRVAAENARAGGLFPLDARLRPEGANGPLVASLESYVDYFQRGRAQPWEFQALTKARVLPGGPLAGEAEATVRGLWERAGERPDVVEQVGAMLARVTRERAGGGGVENAEFKTGAGGLMAAEFCAQALQLRHRVWEPGTLRAFVALEASGALRPDEAAALADGWRCLRRIETTLRREDGRAVSALPPEGAARRRLARRLGFAGEEEFQIAHRAARESIAAVAARVLGSGALA